MNHFVSPLYSFYYDSSAPVELETGVYIREPDSFLFKYLTASQQLSMSQHMSRGKDWVVDIIVEEPKSAKRGSEGRCSTKASNKARSVLQSLRLLHKGKVFTGPLYYLDDPEFAGFRYNMGALHDPDLTTLPLTHPTYLRPDDYQLREQEVEELKAIYALIPEEFSSYPALRLCLDRFGAYFRRSGKLDGLLDLVIALEALFGEGSQGITYKLALRCAYLLESQFKERRQVFDKLRCIDAYMTLGLALSMAGVTCPRNYEHCGKKMIMIKLLSEPLMLQQSMFGGQFARSSRSTWIKCVRQRRIKRIDGINS